MLEIVGESEGFDAPDRGWWTNFWVVSRRQRQEFVDPGIRARNLPLIPKTVFLDLREPRNSSAPFVQGDADARRRPPAQNGAGPVSPEAKICLAGGLSKKRSGSAG